MLTISGASEATDVPVDTLRWWERVGVLPPADRDARGRRTYDEDAVAWIRFARRMRSTGMAVEDVAAYARMVREGERTLAERRRVLEEHRDVVVAAAAELERVLALLDEKIADYRTAEAGVADARPDPPLEHVARLR